MKTAQRRPHTTPGMDDQRFHRPKSRVSNSQNDAGVSAADNHQRLSYGLPSSHLLDDLRNTGPAKPDHSQPSLQKIVDATIFRTAAASLCTSDLLRRPTPMVLSDATLSAAKWLALLLMVVDHSNKYLFDGSVGWMYDFGRVSMPLFAVVLGYNLARPGMLSNGGYRRLAGRLATSGALATAPFIAINDLSHDWPLNMMFTLLVAVMSAWLFDLRRPTATIAACLVLVWGGALGEYWWPAVGLTLCVWAYQRAPTRGLIAAFIACLMLLWFVNGNLWALAVVPVMAGLRGWPVVLPRASRLFYVFYPLHLAAFWAYLAAR